MSKNINMSKKISQTKQKDKHLKFILKSMIQYQQLNNIKGKCIDNAQYYRDCITNLPDNIEVRAVICRGWRIKQREGHRKIVDANLVDVCGHLVVVYNNKIIDPSYEISKLDPYYYFTVKDFAKQTKINLSKKQVKNHLDCVKIAEKINQLRWTQTVSVRCQEYYNNQADYVDKCGF